MATDDDSILDDYFIDAPVVGAGMNGVEMEDGYGDGCGQEDMNSRKRARDDSSAPKSKACREKIRRDKLNDRFLELSSVLSPGKSQKLDKANILSDAARVLAQLRNEAKELKESNEKLQETIKDLKAEKNELRDEKLSLKSEKERLEQQLKAMNMPPAGFMPHPMAFHPAAAAAVPFAAPSQASADKTSPITAAFPGVAMWHWLPHSVLDTTQDPKHWPPNA